MGKILLNMFLIKFINGIKLEINTKTTFVVDIDMEGAAYEGVKLLEDLILQIRFKGENMRKIRIILSIVLILSLTLSFASAKTSYNGFETGDLTKASNKDKATIALDFLSDKNAKAQYKIKNQLAGSDGFTTLRVDQYFNNTRILNSDLIVNIDKKGVVKSLVGKTINLEGVLTRNPKETVKANDAVAIALGDLDFSPVLDDKAKAEKVIFLGDSPRYA